MSLAITTDRDAQGHNIGCLSRSLPAHGSAGAYWICYLLRFVFVPFCVNWENNVCRHIAVVAFARSLGGSIKSSIIRLERLVFLIRAAQKLSNSIRLTCRYATGNNRQLFMRDSSRNGPQLPRSASATVSSQCWPNGFPTATQSLPNRYPVATQ